MGSRNLIEIVIGAKNLTSGELDRIDRRIEKSAAAWRRIGYASVGAGTAGLTTMALMGKSALNNAENIKGLSEQVGMSAEEFQRLSYAAKMSNVSAESVRKSILRATVATVGAVGGNKTYQKAFSDLGISYKDSTGKARAGIDVIMDMSEAFHKGNISAEMLVGGLRAIGLRGGAEMIPFLKEGRAQLEAWMATAPGVISNETIEKLHNYAQVWETIGTQMQGAVATFTADLLPTLTKVSDGVKAVIDKFNALPGSTKEALGTVALLGGVALVAGGNLMILAGGMIAATIASGPAWAVVVWANSFTVAIAGMQVPLLGLTIGFLALWSVLSSIGNSFQMKGARKELESLGKETDDLTKRWAQRQKETGRGFFTPEEATRNQQIVARQGELQDITTKGGSFFGPVAGFRAISKQMTDQIINAGNSFPVQMAGGAAISSTPTPGPFAGIYSGAPAFGSPAVSSSQMGKIIYVDFHATFDKSQDVVDAMAEQVESNL